MWLGLQTVPSLERCPLFRVSFIERFHCICAAPRGNLWKVTLVICTPLHTTRSLPGFLPSPPLPSPPFPSFTLKAGNIPPSTSIERYLMEDLVSNICLTCCSSRKDTVVTLVQQMDRIQQFSLPVLTVEVCKGGWGGQGSERWSFCAVFGLVWVGVASWWVWHGDRHGISWVWHLVGMASWWVWHLVGMASWWMWHVGGRGM